MVYSGHAAADDRPDGTGASLNGAWMIGDSPQADVRGAINVDAHSVWVSGGRPWTEGAYRPTHIAPDTASAIDHVVKVTG
ncbi:HAD hydrolase-like protein [Streptomyces sp. NBC_01613]|uniref:HAD hydrolase-like protein n=1 Tax=Streptomyces sp. NBC_01613 TaxID=2975896 RepID=UPI00386A4FF2